jgi:hypothetical protein
MRYPAVSYPLTVLSSLLSLTLTLFRSVPLSGEMDTSPVGKVNMVRRNVREVYGLIEEIKVDELKKAKNASEYDRGTWKMGPGDGRGERVGRGGGRGGPSRSFGFGSAMKPAMEGNSPSLHC